MGMPIKSLDNVDLLKVVQLSEPKQNFRIDLPDNAFSDYKRLLISFFAAEGTTATWIYTPFNKTSVDGAYVSIGSNVAGCCTIFNDNGQWEYKINGSVATSITPRDSGNFITVRSYYADKTFAAGSIFVLIGERNGE